MLQFPPIAPRGTSPLRSHLYDKAHRAQLNIATKTSPLVEVLETRWRAINNAKRIPWLLLVTAFTGNRPLALLFTASANGLFYSSRHTPCAVTRVPRASPYTEQPKLPSLAARGVETEFFPTWKRDIDENQTNLPII